MNSYLKINFPSQVQTATTRFGWKRLPTKTKATLPFPWTAGRTLPVPGPQRSSTWRASRRTRSSSSGFDQSSSTKTLTTTIWCSVAKIRSNSTKTYTMPPVKYPKAPYVISLAFYYLKLNNFSLQAYLTNLTMDKMYEIKVRGAVHSELNRSEILQGDESLSRKILIQPNCDKLHLFQSQKPSELSAGVIAGCACAAFAMLLAIIAFILWRWKIMLECDN